MADPEYEGAFYKVLPKNDTGQRQSHQGGFVVPADLRKYFPVLEEATALRPAPDAGITAILIDGPDYIGKVDTRYQLQTWGGTRSGETRITGGIDLLLNRAEPGDILAIERRVGAESDYRFSLVRKGTRRHGLIAGLGRNWGPVDRAWPPVTEQEVRAATTELLKEIETPFHPFEEQSGKQVVQRRPARSRAFSRIVIGAYGKRCALCGLGACRDDGYSEVEAAHIVGKADGGSDDPRNGLSLCQSDHWAFDHGVCSVGTDFKVHIHARHLALPGNSRIAALHGRPIVVPEPAGLRPHKIALEWHFSRFSEQRF